MRFFQALDLFFHAQLFALQPVNKRLVACQAFSFFMKVKFNLFVTAFERLKVASVHKILLGS